MKCFSKEWIIGRDQKGKEVDKRPCNEKAIKKCKHGFATCRKHFHGCEDEQNKTKYL